MDHSERYDRSEGRRIRLLDSVAELQPNSRYLAIIDNPTVGSSSVIIWDLQLGKEQTRITGLPPYGGYPQVELLWSPDGKYITFGTGLPILFWDPLSGKIAKELRVEPPVRWARYNKDGTKLLVNREPLGGHGGFRIYDTRNWTYRDYGDDGLLIEALSWTADDMVLVAGEWPKFSIGRTLEGIAPQMSDALARLIDPSGRQPPRTVLLASGSPHQVKTGGTEETVLLQSFWPDWAVANYNTNRISLGVGKIIDAGSLAVLNFASDDDIRTGKIPAGGQAFSPDGNFLYLLGISLDGKARSLVLNAATGKPVGTFPGGHRGLAASPDGHRIAVGNGRVVNVYDVR